jgi:hypothetical protein
VTGIESEMILVRHLLEWADLAATGDGRALEQVRRDVAALTRWHGWTEESAAEFLGVLFGRVDS